MVGAIAAIAHPDLFSKLVMLAASPWYLNDPEYFGGFEQKELGQAMHENYKTWCSGFSPLTVGGDMDSSSVQEFSQTLFNMRPEIDLCVLKHILEGDLRLLNVPFHIVQSTKDLAVPVNVAEYLHQNISAKSVFEVMPTEDHLPQLSSPEIVVPALLRHSRENIAV